MSWTDERVEILTKMWTDGRSAAEIAKELGGITRNAVIGKAHRLGLSGRASPIKKKKVETKVNKPKKTTSAKVSKSTNVTSKKSVSAEQQKLVTEAIKEAAIENGAQNDDSGIGLLDLTEKVCKWPIGDPQDPAFYFCGKFSPQGVPYCPEHAGMAYQAPRKQNAAAKTKGAIKIVADTVSKDTKPASDDQKKTTKDKKAS